MNRPVLPRYLPPPCQDALDLGRVILRDGTTATIRPARPADAGLLQAFYAHLSPESLRHRFFSVAVPDSQLLASLSDSGNPDNALTLLVLRNAGAQAHVVATGSYLAKNATTAEVAFAVDDAFQGKGLGTLLLERLASLAVQHGFTHLWAVTHADNRAMRDVFKESGFALRESQDRSEIEVDLTAIPTAASVLRLETRDRIATTASLRPFFWPRSVAVVGASRDAGSIGQRILTALLEGGFQGPIYPINPRATEILGLRTYPSVRELPRPVDLAVLAVPRDYVAPVIDDCAAHGIRALVVITAGFAEVGAEARALQQALVEKVRGHGMRMVGPNCMGLLNTDPNVRLNATFVPGMPPAGRVAMSSQSGALGLAVLAEAGRRGLGLSTFVSVGNKGDVSGNDLLQYWEEDPGTDVILLYLESFGNPRRFARIARRVSLRKPIIAIKSGRTSAGGRAAGSHTAALASSDTPVAALFQQTGVIRADTLEEMFDLAAALGSQPIPRGRRVAIITNAGGPGILCADACEAGGLEVPELSAATRGKLAEFLPAAAGTTNPVDMIASASPDHFRRTVAVTLACGEVDALIPVYMPVGLAETEAMAAAVRAGIEDARAAGAPRLPVLACFMGGAAGVTPLATGERVPTYAFPEEPARVLAKAAAYASWRAQPPGVFPDFNDLDLRLAKTTCARASNQQGGGWLSADDTRAVLAAMRLPLPSSGVARDADEAVKLARGIGFPVAVKLVSRQVVHKTEWGGVHLNLADEVAVRSAFAQIQRRWTQDQTGTLEGVLVQPMLSGGVEVMVGVTHDPLFGPLIAFGLGGVHVEILGDVCFRVTPLTDRDADEMIRSIRGYRLLQGYRGHPAADTDALAELLLRVSRLVEEVPEISELDLNPIFAFAPGQGCRIIDARIRVKGN